MTLAFEAVMANRYDLLREEQRLEAGRNLLKSYIVETDAREGTPGDQLRVISQGSDTLVSPTDDELLFSLTIGEASFMVEVLDDRFMVFHSLDAADVADAHITRITETRLADSTWFNSDYLNDLLNLGQPLGFSTSFDSTYFSKRPRPETRLALSQKHMTPEMIDTDETQGISTLNIRMSGRDAAFALSVLEQNEYLASHLPLATAKLKHGIDASNIDEVRFDGRLVARGPSFAEHMRLVSSLHDPYAAWLKQTEDNVSFKAVREDGIVSLDGEPIVISFENLDVDIDPTQLLPRLMSGTRPFRFWGVPYASASDSLYVTACDLHGAGTVRIDLTPRLMRIYLEQGTCSNSVLRLYVNLQQTLNRGLPIEAGGQDIRPRLAGLVRA